MLTHDLFVEMHFFLELYVVIELKKNERAMRSGSLSLHIFLDIRLDIRYLDIQRSVRKDQLLQPSKDEQEYNSNVKLDLSFSSHHVY